jgi:hypothetical protein
LAASGISGADIGRHYTRYRTIERFMKEKMSFRSTDIEICDVGCGSAYGTDMLRVGMHPHRVYGVEPCDQSRAYAAICYPEVEVFNDIPEDGKQPEVIVMVESIEHMTLAELRCYIAKSQFVLLTTPLIKNPFNDYHEVPFRKIGDIREHLEKCAFVAIHDVVEKGIKFTTGERGDQYYGIYEYAGKE